MRTYTRKVDLKSQSDSTVSLKTKFQWKLLFKLQFNEGEGPIKKQPWLLGYPKQLLSDSSKVAGHRQP